MRFEEKTASRKKSKISAKFLSTVWFQPLHEMGPTMVAGECDDEFWSGGSWGQQPQRSTVTNKIQTHVFHFAETRLPKEKIN